MKAKILFVLCVLVGALFINAGLDKFFHYMPVPTDMPEKAAKAGAALMAIGWLMPLVGAAELVGGLLLIFKKTRALGAIILVPVLCGILLATINMSPEALPIVIIIIAVIGWVIADNWNRYRPIIGD
ncbi:MAG: DoxX family membrane protein [Bacteroidota bacterium]